MIKVKFALSALVLAVAFGCSSLEHRASFGSSARDNEALLKRVVPVGTAAGDAIGLLEEYGFTCSRVRDRQVRMHKGEQVTGEFAVEDGLYCNADDGNLPERRRWQILLVLEENAVKEYSVTTGTFRP